MRISDKSNQAICKLFTAMLQRAEGTRYTQPWLDVSTGLKPMNLKHRQPYNGLNAFILDLAVSLNGWQTPFFVTVEQLNAMGLRLKRCICDDGQDIYESFLPVFKWIPKYENYITGERISAKDLAELDNAERENIITRFSLRVYAEYNIDQTTMSTDMPEAYQKFVDIAKGEKQNFRQNTNASDAVLDYIINTQGAWRCKIIQTNEGAAYYRPSQDEIHLPHKDVFFKSGSFYSTALHEMTHSTKPIIKRDYGAKKWGDSGYAMEELVAELTAAIVCHDIGIERVVDKEHLAYVNSWKKVIKNKDILPVIIDDIMKCVRYELNHYNKVKSLI